jgi:hypothetical protein
VTLLHFSLPKLIFFVLLATWLRYFFLGKDYMAAPHQIDPRAAVDRKFGPCLFV